MSKAAVSAAVSDESIAGVLRETAAFDLIFDATSARLTSKTGRSWSGWASSSST